MKEYSQALRDWFLKRAFIPSYYGGGTLPAERETAKLKAHVQQCGLVWVTEPNLGSIKGFAGTFADDLKVPGIKALVGCKCDEYDVAEWDAATLFIPGEVTLGEIIAQVIAEGEK